MSVIVSLVIHSPQRYEKFFILSFCRGEKVICMALWVKIGIHKKKGRSRTNIPGICGVAGEGHRIYAGPYRVPPGRYSFPVLSAGEPVCRGGYSGRYFRMPGGDDEDFAGLFSWLRIQISYICILIIYFDVPIGTGSKPTDISTFQRTKRGVWWGRIEKRPQSCDRSPKSAGKRSWYRDE